MNRSNTTRKKIGWLLTSLVLTSLWSLQAMAASSINSTSQNKTKKPAIVSQQAKVTNGSRGYQVLATNDLGMHCSDLDYRIAAILPPYNILHSQVIKIGTSSTSLPRVLDNSGIDLFYSASEHISAVVNTPLAGTGDPVFVNGTYTAPAGFLNPPSGSTTVFKTNFWACKTGAATCSNSDLNSFSAYDPFYPPGILGLFSQQPDYGLPTPDVERLFLGDGVLAADQSVMPGQSNPLTANVPQKFARFNQSYPVFTKFPFGYRADPSWFSAEGIPASNWDDTGRLNAYPLMRLQAVPKGMSPTVSSNVLATLDTTMPVSGEANCRSCHTDSSTGNSGQGGNGAATSGMAVGTVSSAANDPQFGKVPLAVSLEYAADKNILALHDQRTGTRLSDETPVACQRCHYSPALDLAQQGPTTGHGLDQQSHHSMSRAMHYFHAGFLPAMPPPSPQRTPAQTQAALQQTCYTCHPGNNTKCLRGVMAENNVVCQDCHGGMRQVGNDFSKTVSATNPGSFVMDGTLRVPWLNEPGCGSCHTGDALNNMANHKNGANQVNVIKSVDGINLSQAYFTDDVNASAIVPGNAQLGQTGTSGNRRFAEPTVVTALGEKPMLYRFSTGHGGVFCQGCHGSTHAEWGLSAANSNDIVPPVQLQGHSGPIAECTTCHKNDLGVTTKGPHGMHPVGNSRFVLGGHEDYAESHLAECKACHGANLLGTALSKAQAARSLSIEGRSVKIALGQQVACNLCHELPGR